jgi:hypothetical protein
MGPTFVKSFTEISCTVSKINFGGGGGLKLFIYTQIFNNKIYFQQIKLKDIIKGYFTNKKTVRNFRISKK